MLKLTSPYHIHIWKYNCHLYQQIALLYGVQHLKRTVQACLDYIKCVTACWARTELHSIEMNGIGDCCLPQYVHPLELYRSRFLMSNSPFWWNLAGNYNRIHVSSFVCWRFKSKKKRNKTNRKQNNSQRLIMMLQLFAYICDMRWFFVFSLFCLSFICSWHLLGKANTKWKM